MQKLSLGLTGLLICLSSTTVHAQNVPPFFNNAGVGIFDPEISVVNSGVLLDAQAVVSNDRKYVTLNMRPTNTRLLALQSYSVNGPITNGPLGFVGGASPFGTVVFARPTNGNLTPSLQTSPSAVQARSAGLLDRRGMTRLSQ